LLGEERAEPMEAGTFHRARRQPLREAEAHGAKPWMPRSGSSVAFQAE
jgi:hypothetical protein